MSQISNVYKDYDHQPYISDHRNLLEWESTPEKYPYAKVERKQMVLLEEGLFPGDIVMLWRIGFNNFTNESTIPDYCEYRYGIHSDESIKRLIDGGYVIEGGVMDTLDLLNAPTIKRILKDHGLRVSGNKQDLVSRLSTEVSEAELEKRIPLRRFIATPSGLHLLEKYDGIIQAHGPKKM